MSEGDSTAFIPGVVRQLAHAVIEGDAVAACALFDAIAEMRAGGVLSSGLQFLQDATRPCRWAIIDLRSLEAAARCLRQEDGPLAADLRAIAQGAEQLVFQRLPPRGVIDLAIYEIFHERVRDIARTYRQLLYKAHENRADWSKAEVRTYQATESLEQLVERSRHKFHTGPLLRTASELFCPQNEPERTCVRSLVRKLLGRTKWQMHCLSEEEVEQGCALAYSQLQSGAWRRVKLGPRSTPMLHTMHKRTCRDQKLASAERGVR